MLKVRGDRSRSVPKTLCTPKEEGLWGDLKGEKRELESGVRKRGLEAKDRAKQSERDFRPCNSEMKSEKGDLDIERRSK